METSAIDIPQTVTDKWQEITNLVAELVQVPAALVTRIEPPEISVFVASKSRGNPYQPRARGRLNTGLYCETVMRTRQFLLVPDARDDDQWRSNPDIKLGMISYLGLPISWPDGDIFGTICVLDHKRNAYREVHHRLLLQLRDAVEADLRSVFLYETRLADEKRVTNSPGSMTHCRSKLRNTSVPRQLCERASSAFATTPRRLPIGSGRPGRTTVSSGYPSKSRRLASTPRSGSARRDGISPPTSRRSRRSGAITSRPSRRTSHFTTSGMGPPAGTARCSTLP
jgi:hypothetical protein